jgi:hypothetical protein
MIRNKSGMRIRFLMFSFFLLGGRAALAQGPVPKPKKRPIPVSQEFVDNMRDKAKFLHPTSRVSDALGAMGATKNALGGPQISSVPLFNGSFSFQGTTFPFTMVGHQPSSGQVAHVKTTMIPVILVFPDIPDQNGNPFVFDPTGIVSATINSPIWENAGFSTGFTQYGDAIQRAEFFNHDDEHEWHVLLNNPEMQKALVVLVPGDDANIFVLTDANGNPVGTPFAVLDDEFWAFQLETILQLADVETNELAVILTQDMFIAANADPSHGFALGFHNAIPVSQNGNVLKVQTFAWGSWVDTTTLQGAFADILPLSHEIAEWLNDPFGTNPVPLFQVNGAAPGTCQGNLEVGDPLGGTPFPITTDGFVYHPQVVALLQWFERKTPSDAFSHAYSYPDTTILTSPPPVCVPAPPPKSK